MNISLKKLSREQRHRFVAKLLRELYEEDLPETKKELADLYHHHLALSGRSLKEHNLLPNMQEIDREKAEPFLPISIYLDHIRSAHNVGSIIRTTEALRLGHIYLSSQTPGPENKKVRDAAMGADQWVPVDRKPLSELPRPIIAIETCGEPMTTFPEAFTLVMGNEEYGCSQEVLQMADQIVSVPLYGKKNSLNVANCYAIVANEIRKMGGG